MTGSQRTLLMTLFAGGCLAASPVAAQVYFPQPYLQGSIGVAVPDDADINGGGISGKLKLDSGVDATVALGIHLPFDFRVEGEVGYINADLSKVTVPGVGSTNLSGEARVYTLMGNVYYDFRNVTPFTPYLGGGLGVAHQHLDNVSVGGIPVSSGGERDDFAWQLEAGLSFDVLPNLAIVPSYRFLRIENERTTNGVTVGNADTNIFKLGLRLTF